ncbi:MAG: flagellar biosynthesis protein FlhA [Hyphomicrobiaceae bacterium]
MAVAPPVSMSTTAWWWTRDIGFAIGIVLVLVILFLPIPAPLIDLGLAFSIALSVLILMVALWIQRPLDFSAFPTVLLMATMLRLALNIATTRLILTEGANGHAAAGHVIAGFSNFVMGGDFVIGLVVFLILLTVNFIVITKGASRIAEVGARFALDGIPGKQMAIDADLSSGLIDEREAQRRRRELEEESSFFGAMDGASKFVRGDAIAGLLITAINIIGGILVATLRHGMPLADAVDVFTKLSVGDGVVSQMPALIISLAAGLVVAKGGAHGAVEKAVLGQLGNYPKALVVTAMLTGILALMPGLPFFPFALLAATAALAGYFIPLRVAEATAAAEAQAREIDHQAQEEARQSIKVELKFSEIEIVLGQQLSAVFIRKQEELVQRVGKLRRKFARQYGFVVPEIQLSDDFSLAPRVYQIRLHGVPIATQELPIGEVLVVIGDGPRPTVPGTETREPAFGMRALWVPETFVGELKRQGFTAVDTMTILLTHLSEAIRNNLAQLFSFRDMQLIIEGMPGEYKRLLDEIRPSQISNSGIQAVLKLLLAEKVSIRNLQLILEAIAEVAPHSRRAEHITEHVRQRLAPQICADLVKDGVLTVLRLGARWDLAFHEGLRRDQRGEIVEFDIDPRLIEDFSKDASRVIQGFIDAGETFAIVTSVEARPFVRMVIERLFSTLPILSHAELARGVQLKSLGSIG